MPDWLVIRAQYEQQGLPKTALARMHGISRQAIQQQAKKDHWIAPLLASPNLFLAPPQAETSVENDDLSDVDLVKKALAQLARFLSDDGLVTLNQHKLFADALSQYIKLKLTIPNEQEQSPYDMREFLSLCTEEELQHVRPVIAAVQARKAEQEEKIKPIRKIG